MNEIKQVKVAFVSRDQWDKIWLALKPQERILVDRLLLVAKDILVLDVGGREELVTGDAVLEAIGEPYDFIGKTR